MRSGRLFYTTTASVDVLAPLTRGGPETAIAMMDELVSDIIGIVICAPAVRAITQTAPNVAMSITPNWGTDAIGNSFVTSPSRGLRSP